MLVAAKSIAPETALRPRLALVVVVVGPGAGKGCCPDGGFCFWGLWRSKGAGAGVMAAGAWHTSVRICSGCCRECSG